MQGCAHLMTGPQPHTSELGTMKLPLVGSNFPLAQVGEKPLSDLEKKNVLNSITKPFKCLFWIFSPDLIVF